MFTGKQYFVNVGPPCKVFFQYVSRWSAFVNTRQKTKTKPKIPSVHSVIGTLLLPFSNFSIVKENRLRVKLLSLERKGGEF